jgi:perosamine synthetase
MTEKLRVPFFRPDLRDEEIDAVTRVLRSGWLTTGSVARRFEQEFARSVGASHAVAVNSCTAALHLSVEALGLRAGDAVLVPTMTFAATAEVVRYLGAIPVLVDCDPESLNLDLEDAERRMAMLESGRLRGVAPGTRAVGIIPVHVGGAMLDVARLRDWARARGLWVVEDAAHAFPAAWRPGASESWQRCGEATAEISCFSFYANKTITTGEGGMAVTENAALADRMRSMSLHGLSRDAWDRYSGGGSWDYRILAPGFKYNLTDLAAALGCEQLARAESMRERREAIARRYRHELADLDEVVLAPEPENRLHAWHLFWVRLIGERLTIDRDAMIRELREEGVATSVHWRPLHCHPYYQETFGYSATDLPVAARTWKGLISLPLFPTMEEREVEAVVSSLRSLCARHRRSASAAVRK